MELKGNKRWWQHTVSC